MTEISRYAPGSFSWAELATSDAAGAEKFYTAVLPWTPRKGDDYTERQVGSRSIGGMMQIPPEWGPVPPHWIVFFEVADTDGIAAKSQSLGGGVRVPPTDIPKIGRFAVLHDPQGANFAVVKLDPAFRT